MNEMFLKEFGYDEWTTTHGVLVCPHGNRIEDDLRTGHHDCGCVSPLHEQLGI
jgi:hypothetical protein